MHGRALRGAALICAIVGCLVTQATAASAPALPLAPSNFVGINIDGPVYPVSASGVNLVQQLGAMEQAGVESVRVVFNWSFAQPYASWSQVPSAEAYQYVNAGGMPTNFSQIDQIVGLAAADGMTILPTVIYAPDWDVTAQTTAHYGRPARDQPYANFLTQLVRRYGPHGSFWSGRSRALPIRRWQIWNEPNIGYYWPTQPFAPTYVALLKAAHVAIKRADPGGSVVLAGIPNYSWLDLEHIYAVKGARSAFDEVAVHPYTAKPAGVITILQKVRRVMDEHGDAAKPLIADEVSWTSSLGQTDHNVGLDIATTPAGQARNIATLLPMLDRDRAVLGLSAFYYYTWASDEVENGLTFAFAGLLKYTNGALSPKPAFVAFRHAALAMEQCKRKGARASLCAQRGSP